jgi:hypothetical protein
MRFLSEAECKTAGWKCVEDACEAEGCHYDKKKKMCVPGDDMPGILKKLLDGSRCVTFKCSSPACRITLPITKDTLFGEYNGVIRFSPVTGKLHMCYGPWLRGDEMVKRPVISTMIDPSDSKKLWSWYHKTGRALFKKRIAESGTVKVYAELFSLPGASVQLTYPEVMLLQKHAETLKGVCEADKEKGYTLKCLSICPFSDEPLYLKTDDKEVEKFDQVQENLINKFGKSSSCKPDDLYKDNIFDPFLSCGGLMPDMATVEKKKKQSVCLDGKLKCEEDKYTKYSFTTYNEAELVEAIQNSELNCVDDAPPKPDARTEARAETSLSMTEDDALSTSDYSDTD